MLQELVSERTVHQSHLREAEVGKFDMTHQRDQQAAVKQTDR